jgi:hypothetical protein
MGSHPRSRIYTKVIERRRDTGERMDALVIPGLF